MAFVWFDFSFFRPVSPPFSHGIFQPRPQESSPGVSYEVMYYLTQSIPKGGRGGGGGLFPYKRLMGCAAGCGRIFTTGLTIMGSHIFEFLGIRHLFSIYVRLANVPECLHCRRKVKCSLFNLKHGSIHKNRKWLSWDRENYIFAQRCRGWGLQLATEYRLL